MPPRWSGRFACLQWLAGGVKFIDAVGLVWVVPYLGGMALISWLGNYGGGRHVLLTGVDYLLILLLTCAVLFIATYVGVDRRSTTLRLKQG